MSELRVAVYYRVGSIEQALSPHEAMLLKYARDNGYDVKAVLTDIGNGADMSRPGLRRIEALAASGEIDMVLAAKCSRITRDSAALLAFAERLASFGVELRTPLDGMTTEQLRAICLLRGILQESEASAGAASEN